MMNDAITGKFSALVPPGIKPHLKWRLVVSGSIMGILLFICWAMGWLGVPGLARAADVEQLQKRVNISAQLNLATEIRLQVRARCMVPDQVTKDSITRYIDDLQRQYKEIAGDRYPEAPCPS